MNLKGKTLDIFRTITFNNFKLILVKPILGKISSLIEQLSYVKF